jgi:hypothetical protein
LCLWSVPLISSDVASLIGSFDLLSRCASDRFLWSPLTLRLWSVPLIRCLLSRSTLLSRSYLTGTRTPVQGLSFVFNSALASVASESNNSVSVRCRGKRYLEPLRRKWPYPSQYVLRFIPICDLFTDSPSYYCVLHLHSGEDELKHRAHIFSVFISRPTISLIFPLWYSYFRLIK